METIKRLFTAGAVFSIIIGCILVTFMWAGSEVMMTKLGFETKTSLRAQLAQVNAVVQTQQASLLTADKTIKDLKAENVRILNEVKELQQVNKVDTEVVQEVKDTLVKKTEPIKRQVGKRKVVTTDTITLPVAEIDALSLENVRAINALHDELFADA